MKAFVLLLPLGAAVWMLAIVGVLYLIGAIR